MSDEELAAELALAKAEQDMHVETLSLGGRPSAEAYCNLRIAYLNGVIQKLEAEKTKNPTITAWLRSMNRGG